MESRSSEIPSIVSQYLAAKQSKIKEKAACLDIILPQSIDPVLVSQMINDLTETKIYYRLWQRHRLDFSEWPSLGFICGKTQTIPVWPGEQEPLHVIFIAPLHAIDARENLFDADGIFADFKKLSSDNSVKSRVWLSLEGESRNCHIDVCYCYASRRYAHKNEEAPDDGVYFKQVAKGVALEKSATWDHMIDDCYQLFPQGLFTKTINWKELFVTLRPDEAVEVRETVPAVPSSLPEIALLKHFCNLSPREANDFIHKWFDKCSEAYSAAAKGQNDNPFAILWHALIRSDVKKIDWTVIDDALQAIERDVIDSLVPFSSIELNHLKRIFNNMKCLIITKEMPEHYEPHYMNVRGADLGDADLSDAILSDLVFDGVNFVRAKLDRVVFKRSKFHNCSLSKASLIEADLSEADLMYPSFNEAILIRVNGKAASFYRPEFSEALLIEASFPMSRFINPYFSDANLNGAFFNDAVLHKGHFTGAIALSTSFVGATLTDTCVTGKINGLDFSYCKIDWETFLKTDSDLTTSTFIPDLIMRNEVFFKEYLTEVESLSLTVQTGVKLRNLLADTILVRTKTLEPEQASKVLKTAMEHDFFIKRPVAGFEIVTAAFARLFSQDEKPDCLKRLAAACENIVLAPVIADGSSLRA